MFHLEVFTHKRSIVFFGSLLVGQFFLLFLISGRALDVNVIVFDGPSQIIRFAKQLQHVLPRLLCHLEIRDLTGNIRGEHDINTCRRGNRMESRSKVHIDELEIVQSIVWRSLLCDRRSKAEHNQRHQ